MKYSLTKILNKNIQVEWVYTSVILGLLFFILLHNELTQNSSIFALLLFALFFSIYMLYQINIKRKVYRKLQYLFDVSNEIPLNKVNQENLQYFELNKILDNLCDAYKNEEAYRKQIEAKNSELRQIIDLVPIKYLPKIDMGDLYWLIKQRLLVMG
ncbi:hypothetical protein [Psychromonas sp. MME2]|uniref:hypothetical protein n=1 Tax=unclassified Psychromonas TaxID=2614957 RepID=UPI00339C06F6